MKKYKKRLRFSFKKLFKLLLTNSCYVVIGSVAIVYFIIRDISRVVAKLFKQLPKLLQALMIYSLIIGNVPNLINTIEVVKSWEIETPQVEKLSTDLKQVVKENKVEETETLQVEEIKVENTCQLSEIECQIFNTSKASGLTNEQSYLLLAISKHETGRWTSNLFNNNNNLGGIYNSKEQKFFKYQTRQDGIQAFVNLLKNRYFGKGLNTIEQIGNVYCPVGATNDPNNKNIHWIPTVTQFYNEYLQSVE